MRSLKTEARPFMHVFVFRERENRIDTRDASVPLLQNAFPDRIDMLD